MPNYRHLIGTSISFLIVIAHALPAWADNSVGTISFGSGVQDYIQTFYSWSIGAGLALAILMLIYAGYVMITSAGDPQRVGFAKEIIVGSLSGIALLIAARLVLNILSVNQPLPNISRLDTNLKTELVLRWPTQPLG